MVGGAAAGVAGSESELIERNTLLKLEHQQMKKYGMLHEKINGFKESIQQTVSIVHAK